MYFLQFEFVLTFTLLSISTVWDNRTRQFSDFQRFYKNAPNFWMEVKIDIEKTPFWNQFFMYFHVLTSFFNERESFSKTSDANKHQKLKQNFKYKFFGYIFYLFKKKWEKMVSAL